MRDHACNKLDVKRRLIVEAVGKYKPKKERCFVSEYVQYMQKYHSSLELPESDSLMMTKKIAQMIILREGKSVEKRDLILKKRDCQPYFNKHNSHVLKIVEPVFVSPHFDFK